MLSDLSFRRLNFVHIFHELTPYARHPPFFSSLTTYLPHSVLFFIFYLSREAYPDWHCVKHGKRCIHAPACMAFSRKYFAHLTLVLVFRWMCSGQCVTSKSSIIISLLCSVWLISWTFGLLRNSIPQNRHLSHLNCVRNRSLNQMPENSNHPVYKYIHRQNRINNSRFTNEIHMQISTQFAGWLFDSAYTHTPIDSGYFLYALQRICWRKSGPKERRYSPNATACQIKI